MATKAPSKVRPGFTRVLIPERNKTIQIRTKNVLNQNYMTKHGLVAIPEPMKPPVNIIDPDTGTTTFAALGKGGGGGSDINATVKQVTKAAPVKTKTNG